MHGSWFPSKDENKLQSDYSWEKFLFHILTVGFHSLNDSLVLVKMLAHAFVSSKDHNKLDSRYSLNDAAENQ